MAKQQSPANDKIALENRRTEAAQEYSRIHGMLMSKRQYVEDREGLLDYLSLPGDYEAMAELTDEISRGRRQLKDLMRQASDAHNRAWEGLQ